MVVILLIAACSGEQQKNYTSDSSENAESYDYASESNQNAAKTEEMDHENAKQAIKRMLIYNANLRVEVKDFNTTRKQIEELITTMNGYIVQSNSYNQNLNQMNGSMTIRIPQEHFEHFLLAVESLDIKVIERNVSGNDVTEEYIDLQSRLKAKVAVETRLLEFMNKAKETKDLLAISNDLSSVQEEIERLKGRMKYLENHVSLSTVSITMIENKVVVPEIEKDELNTWEKSKKQFIDSINLLLSFISGLTVLIIGSLPIFLPVLLVGIVIWYLWIKKRDSQDKDINN